MPDSQLYLLNFKRYLFSKNPQLGIINFKREEHKCIIHFYETILSRGELEGYLNLLLIYYIQFIKYLFICIYTVMVMNKNIIYFLLWMQLRNSFVWQLGFINFVMFNITKHIATFFSQLLFLVIWKSTCEPSFVRIVVLEEFQAVFTVLYVAVGPGVARGVWIFFFNFRSF